MGDQIKGDRFDELSEKWLDKTITPEEEIEYAQWYNAGQGRNIDIPGEFAESENELRDRIYDKVINASDGKRVIRINRYRFLKIAATVLIFLGAGIYLYVHFDHRPFIDKHSIAEKGRGRDATSIVPGGNNAVLTLADGRKVVLNDVGNGTIARPQDCDIVKSSDGQLIYRDFDKKLNRNTGLVEQNILSTPRGGSYRVLLSDGTAVWLNAASALTYPLKFTGNERIVHLNGEAYFEVAHDPEHPFKVVSGGQQVEVLGTHFNINSYQDESTIKTTLLEGSVKVSAVGQNKVQFLKPGQQAEFKGQHFIIHDIDTDQAVSWKNGLFTFENMSIKQIMRMLARWYDVDIVYKGDVSNVIFGGSVSRFTNIKDVLDNLELTGRVHFSTQGRVVTVSK